MSKFSLRVETRKVLVSSEIFLLQRSKAHVCHNSNSGGPKLRRKLATCSLFLTSMATIFKILGIVISACGCSRNICTE